MKQGSMADEAGFVCCRSRLRMPMKPYAYTKLLIFLLLDGLFVFFKKNGQVQNFAQPKLARLPNFLYLRE